MVDSSSELRVSEFIDDLQASGRYTFTSGDLRDAVGGSAVSRQAAIRRLKRRPGRIVSPRRGFFVIVPVEYRVAGSPPASWFIDDLMVDAGRPYYVALLTAASLHGASHQQPQVFQVMTDVLVRGMRAGRQRIEFHRNRNITDVSVVTLKTETGTMRVSTPEATALDLVRYQESCGHLDHVVAVLVELAEQMRPEKLVDAARVTSRPTVQRLGFVLERLGRTDLSGPLARLVVAWRRRPVLLRPRGAGGERPAASSDSLWYVIPNTEIAVDP